MNDIPFERTILARLLRHSSDECEFEEIGSCIWCTTHHVRIGVTEFVVRIIEKHGS